MDSMFEITMPVESGCNAQLADPYLLNYYEQADNRIIWLDTELTESGIEIAKKIMMWNLEDSDKNVPVEERKPIKLMLMSPGGDIYAMLSLSDTIRLSKTPVYTCVFGLAASAASVLLISGHKRFCMPTAHAMWHSGSAGVSGTMNQVKDASKHLDVIETQMKQLLLERTKVDAKKFKKVQDQDWYLTAADMIEWGFVDKVVEDLDEILS